MAKKYPQIGSMVANSDRQTGEPQRDQNGKQRYSVKVDKNVDLRVNGQKVTGYLNVSRPRDKFDRMLASGVITPAEHAEKVARFEKGGDLAFVQFEISATIEE